jgi:acetylornithine/N-succinyldiaminopimelate aminotransferase
LEPIQGEGGIRSFPAEILREIRSICNDGGLLLVLDEVQTGFGRTGKMFAHEWAGIVPDIVATAKGLGAGYPMGAVLASAEVGKAITPGSHGTTLGGAPLASAVGNALLDVLLGEGFLDDDRGRAGHVTRVGDLLKAGLEEVVRCYPETLEEVRGTGLLLGLKCRVENRQFMAGLQELGLLTAPAGQNVVRILPPLNIEESHINEAIGIIRKACEATRP